MRTPTDPAGESVWSTEQLRPVVTDDRDRGITAGRLGRVEIDRHVLLLITREESRRKFVTAPLLLLPVLQRPTPAPRTPTDNAVVPF